MIANENAASTGIESGANIQSTLNPDDKRDAAVVQRARFCAARMLFAAVPFAQKRTIAGPLPTADDGIGGDHGQ